MTVVFRHHETMEVNRVEYHGSISLAELRMMAEFQAANPTWLTYDTLSLIAPDADFRAVELATLDQLFAHYHALLQPMQFLIMRRSAWLNLSPAAQQHVDYWVLGRDAKGMSSDIRQFESFETAAGWLVLNAHDAAALESGAGFAEVVRYTIPPELPRAR